MLATVQILSNSEILVAGVAGFEPTNAGIKIPCLTAWRHPNIETLERKWGERWDSNPRPPGPQSGALTNWATLAVLTFLAHLKGLEPPTHGLEGRCSILLSYRRRLLCAEVPIFVGAGDGNRTHATSLEGWCSTIELHPRFTQC